MMLSSLGLLGFSKKKANNNHQTIESHLSQILPYLQQEDHISLKLTCRIFYYWFVASELWVGMKIQIAEQKMEHYEDFQFEQSEPKQISKRDKNIRIHSLKKQSENKMPKREASNIKEKGKAIMSNNELLFRNTEIGFKRLLKTNNSQRGAHLMLSSSKVEDIYAIGDPEEYLIKINEAWSINMKKAQKLTQLIKKLNQFHHKLLIQMKSPCKDMHSLVIRIKQNEQKIRQYYRKTTSEPFCSILQSTQGANQGLLIEEQLNKVCKLFWANHHSILGQAQEIDPLLQLCQDQKLKLEKQKKITETSSIGFLESISSTQELINNYGSFAEKYPTLSRQLCPVFINVYASSVQAHESCQIYFQQNQSLELRQISWKHLVHHSFFFETLFQIMNSMCVKLLKLASSYCSDDLTLAVTLTKIRNLKTLSHSIVNVSKYFGKLRKQLEEKKMKAKSEVIRQFLGQYEGRNMEILFQIKNPAKLDKWIGELKEKIAILKSKMQLQ